MSVLADSRARPRRVFVAVAARVYGEAVTSVLERDDRFEVVGGCSDDGEMLAGVTRADAEVALIDAELLCSAAARVLAATLPALRVVAVAVPERPADVIACVEAGACAYVRRDATVRDLVEIIERAVRGEAVCTPVEAGALVRRLATLALAEAPDAARAPLTVRELEVLALIERGLTNKVIARRLGVSVSTVKHHVHNILSKLEVARRGEAVAWLRGHRLAEPDGAPFSA